MDKYIDKLIENKWFMKIVALVLALLLFDNVYDPNKNVTDINVPQLEDTEIVENVPVKSYYDTENLVVTGVPDKVKVKIKGPRNLLQPAIKQGSFEVYVDLTKAKIGTDKVKIKIKRLSDKLEAKIEPAYATVTVHERVTKDFSVEPEINDSVVAKGYIADQPIVKPDKVKITGAKEIIEKIAYVKATISNLREPLKETASEKALVTVLDQNLNKLNVSVEPETVEVQIPISSSSKTVPINIVRQGTSPEGITIESIKISKEKANIIASDEVLKKTNSVRVEVDISKIKDDMTINLPVIISNDIVEVDPKTVEVNIKVSKEEDKTLSNIPIQVRGLSADNEITYRDPSNGLVSLFVSGPSHIINSITASNFDIYLDISDLDEGSHNVTINVAGPNDVNWKLNKKSAKITITQKDA
ncbi:CdaR family protein [Bacillus massilinigeriensis]|uniref:CdaR family protein n=1 Tax=Bacillus massilionigeriensis TaxID=1805475 RepID=UPI000A061B25|nr:CdaR family protein [Bacillus massilionigeriensis]